MKKIIRILMILSFFISISICCKSSLIYGQIELKEPSDIASDIASDISEEKPLGDSVLKTLKNLIQAEANLEEQLKVKKREYRSAKTPGEKAVIEEEIVNLNKLLENLHKDFEKVATGGAMDNLGKKSEEEFNWQDEIKSLLAPFIHELKKMTARPREIEKFRGEITVYEHQLSFVKKSIENLDILFQQVDEEDKNLKKHLETLKTEWIDREKQIANNLRVATHQLKDILNQKQSFWESIHNILQTFFKTRGKNLSLAFLSFLSFFIILRIFHRFIYSISPAHKSGSRSFVIRLIDVLYHILTITGSVMVLLIVLYISGDWLLLSFSIIFILGLIWTAKAGLPRSWKQLQLILNLGNVRENERIIYNGIPWKVIRLNIYAWLENPAFSPSIIRLPLKDIIDMNSRYYNEDEPWFPCNKGDWVILSDGTLGQVIIQTSDMVQIVLKGGTRKTYLTQDFLGQAPMNISTDFRLNVVFGLDYKHQAVITNEIPEKLKKALKQGLISRGYEEDIIKLFVDVNAAGSSSLDLIIIADFLGRAADHYEKLQRIIQTITIDACTANGWNIPFPQLTLHTDVLKLENAEKKDE